MTNKISTYQYITTNNGKPLMSLLRSHGCNKKPRNMQELEIITKEFASKKGDVFTDELTEIHPDFKIFEAYFDKKYAEKIEKIKGEVIKDEKEKYFCANAENKPKENVNFTIPTSSRAMDVVMGVGISLAATALVVSLVNAMRK